MATHALEYRDPERYAKDFALEYVSAKAVLEGRDPYVPMRTLIKEEFPVDDAYVRERIVPGRNWHPPFKFIIVVPLAGLPFEAAGVIWLLASAACVVGAGALVGRRLGWSRWQAASLGAAFIAAPVTQKDLSFGQVNGQLLLLLVLAWLWAERDKQVWAGAALGAAIAIKVFPALLLLPMLFMARRRLIAVAVSVAAALSGLGVIFAGAAHIVELLLDAGKGGFAYWNASPPNVSLWGAINRWTTPNSWTPNLDMTWLGTIAGVIAIAGVLALAVRFKQEPGAYWTWLIVVLLAWPIVWDHYLVLVLPWVAISMTDVMRDPTPGRLAAAGAIGVLLVLGIPPSVSPLTGPVPAFESALLYALPTWALIAALAHDVVRRSRVSRLA